MHRRNDLHSRLAGLTSALNATTQDDHDALVELEKLLLVSHLDDPAALIPRELSIELAARFAAESLSDERQLRLSQLVESLPADAEPQFRVFRREAPMAAPMLHLAAPSWGRGALPERTIGPFQGVDGRLFWFDFFAIIRMVPLYFAGDPQPAMLFFERERLTLLDRITHQHSLVRSSVWIRATLLAAAAPAGGYVGLQVEGGKLRFSVNPANVGGKLTMPAGSTCQVTLDVSPSPAAAPSPGRAGRDAAESVLNTPKTFAFELRAGHATTAEIGRAAWELYDAPMIFEWDRNTAPSYEPLLHSVLLPLVANEMAFRPHRMRSVFGELKGDTQIQRSAWTLPVSMIDVQNPTEAGSSGGLAIQTSQGLTLAWRGLLEGPVLLRRPWKELSCPSSACASKCRRCAIISSRLPGPVPAGQLATSSAVFARCPRTLLFAYPLILSAFR